MSSYKYSQVILIELFAVFQGLAFGIIPALSSILTNESFHHLSDKEFHTLFTPFILSSVIYASVAGWISHKWNVYWVFISGMIANLVGLLLLALTAITISHHGFTLGILFVALFLIGGGVGLNMMTLSRWMPALFPKRPYSALLILWAGASFGVTLAGAVVAYSLELHMWWMAPGLIMGGFFILLILIDLFDNYPTIKLEYNGGLKIDVIFFALAAILYGYIEAVMGLWLKFAPSEFDPRYLAFWAVGTASRIFIAFTLLVISPKVWYLILPIVLVISVIYAPGFYFLLAFSVTALIVLNIGLAQSKYREHKSLVTGISLACYLLGIGLGGFFHTEEKPTLLMLIFSIAVLVLHILTVTTHSYSNKDDAQHKKTGG